MSKLESSENKKLQNNSCCSIENKNKYELKSDTNRIKNDD